MVQTIDANVARGREADLQDAVDFTKNLLADPAGPWAFRQCGISATQVREWLSRAEAYLQGYDALLI